MLLLSIQLCNYVYVVLEVVLEDFEVTIKSFWSQEPLQEVYVLHLKDVVIDQVDVSNIQQEIVSE